ncbi:hypothetical protein C8F01DRAFT_634365 [Mycena amicta]|nr:hypothetical protein C8F01DRAFT_634365 [Mycena amicta]
MQPLRGQVRPPLLSSCPFLHMSHFQYKPVGIHYELQLVLFMPRLLLRWLGDCLLDSIRRGIGIKESGLTHGTILSVFLIYVLAVDIMLFFHLRTVAVKGQDHDVDRKVELTRAEAFVNSHDLGARDAESSAAMSGNKYSPSQAPYPLLLPMRVGLYTDVWAWARREGYERDHAGVFKGEELTDEDAVAEAERPGFFVVMGN